MKFHPAGMCSAVTAARWIRNPEDCLAELEEWIRTITALFCFDGSHSQWTLPREESREWKHNLWKTGKRHNFYCESLALFLASRREIPISLAPFERLQEVLESQTLDNELRSFQQDLLKVEKQFRLLKLWCYMQKELNEEQEVKGTDLQPQATGNAPSLAIAGQLGLQIDARLGEVVRTCPHHSRPHIVQISPKSSFDLFQALIEAGENGSRIDWIARRLGIGERAVASRRVVLNDSLRNLCLEVPSRRYQIMDKKTLR